MLKLTTNYHSRATDLPDLFRDVFAASEGEEEGTLIGALVSDLLATTDRDDLMVSLALDGDLLVGCILFSRLRYDQDPRQVYLMAPVAIRTDRQKTGIGQKLIGFGLEELRRRQVDWAVTYGDPVYYTKSGFQPITEETARAPKPLSMPHGWLGQPLNGEAMKPIKGPSRCVSAFDNPGLW